MSEEGSPKEPDLRFSEHERNQVKVSRNLSADGHLARGDRTTMSRLNFTARARPADPGERDTAFSARPEERAAATPAPEPPAPVPPESDTLIHKLSRLLGL